MGRRRLPISTWLAILGGLLALEFAVLAIAPNSRSDWLLENALAVLAVAAIALSHRRFPFSRMSYLMIFIFLSLHEVGAHYTYSEVPYDAACQRWLGFSLDAALGFERNHFDRLVHFCYGLLLAYPIREIFLRVADVRGFWGYFLPLDLTMSTSMIYELIEWGAASVFGGGLGQAYLGTQGDAWDAHKRHGAGEPRRRVRHAGHARRQPAPRPRHRRRVRGEPTGQAPRAAGRRGDRPLAVAALPGRVIRGRGGIDSIRVRR